MSHSQATCEDCGKIGKPKGIVYFKGKYRCGHCKLKAGNMMPMCLPLLNTWDRVISALKNAPIKTPLFSDSPVPSTFKGGRK
jgi:hypothetical protein